MAPTQFDERTEVHDQTSVAKHDDAVTGCQWHQILRLPVGTLHSAIVPGCLLSGLHSSMSGQKECLRRRCRGRPSGSNIKRYASCAHPWLSAATDSTS